jgi:hypothetical protein
MSKMKYQTTEDVEAQYAGGQPSPAPPQPSRHGHRGWWFVIIPGGVIAAIAAIAIGTSGGTTVTHGTTSPTVATAPAQPAAAAPVPAPVPSPNATGSGNADYQIPSDIYGQVILTGEVDVKNTGNVGIVAKVKMHWQLTGYPDITQRKTVKVPYGQTVRVIFNKPVGSFSGNGQNIVDAIQSYQGAHMDSPYGNFDLTLVSTYGQAH